MARKTELTELEKQPEGVFEGVRILWDRDDFESVASWLHGAAMCQPWANRALQDELFLLQEVADARFELQRMHARQRLHARGKA